MIRCQLKSIKYGGKEVLSDISFRLKEGELLCVSGSSGSGKSTLLSFIGGLLQDDHRVSIDGECMFAEGSKDNSAYIAQNPDANIIAGDVMSQLLLAGSDERSSFDQAFDLFNLPESLLGKKTDWLSGGEKQLLAVASAFMRDCSVYLLDEPTSMLDSQNTQIVTGAVEQLKKSGKSVIVATQQGDEWPSCNQNLQLTSSNSDWCYPFDQIPSKHPSDSILLEADDLSFGYEDTRLFENLSFELKGGEVLHIQGRNGSGKTTLAMLLAGLLKPDGGTVRLNGDEIGHREHYLPSDCGITFQNPNWQLLFSTVRREVTSAGETYESDFHVNVLDAFWDALEQCGIHKEDDPRELSFGQRKFLANNFYSNLPKVHIFDEPEVGLDSKMRHLFRNLVDFRKSVGRISIIISHRPIDFCDYVIELG